MRRTASGPPTGPQACTHRRPSTSGGAGSGRPEVRHPYASHQPGPSSCHPPQPWTQPGASPSLSKWRTHRVPGHPRIQNHSATGVIAGSMDIITAVLTGHGIAVSTAPTSLQPPGLPATKFPFGIRLASGDSPVNPDALRRSLSHATAPKSPPHLGVENGLGNCPVLPPLFPVLKPLFLTGVNWSIEVRTAGQACQSECHLFKPCYTLGGVVPM